MFPLRRFRTGAAPKKKAKADVATPKKTDEQPVVLGAEAALPKEALQVKVQMTKHNMAAVALVERVHTLPEHSWANNEQNISSLKSAFNDMENAMSSFGKEFLFQEVKAMKTNIGTFWLSELEKFVGVKKLFGVVASMAKQMLKRHGVAQ